MSVPVPVPVTKPVPNQTPKAPEITTPVIVVLAIVGILSTIFSGGSQYAY